MESFTVPKPFILLPLWSSTWENVTKLTMWNRLRIKCLFTSYQRKGWSAARGDALFLYSDYQKWLSRTKPASGRIRHCTTPVNKYKAFAQSHKRIWVADVSCTPGSAALVDDMITDYLWFSPAQVMIASEPCQKRFLVFGKTIDVQLAGNAWQRELGGFSF